MYIVMGEGLSFNVDKLVTHFVMKCNGETPILAVESVTHRKGLRATIVFFEVMGFNILMCTQKVTELCGSEYCNYYHITPHVQKGTRVFGT